MRRCILHGWVSWSILSSSIYWVRKSNFHVTKNTYVDVDVDVDEINIILCTSRYIEMDEDDEIDLDFNEEDDVRHDDDKNEE